MIKGDYGKVLQGNNINSGRAAAIKMADFIAQVQEDYLLTREVFFLIRDVYELPIDFADNLLQSIRFASVRKQLPGSIKDVFQRVDKIVSDNKRKGKKFPGLLLVRRSKAQNRNFDKRAFPPGTEKRIPFKKSKERERSCQRI